MVTSVVSSRPAFGEGRREWKTVARSGKVATRSGRVARRGVEECGERRRGRVTRTGVKEWQ